MFRILLSVLSANRAEPSSLRPWALLVRAREHSAIRPSSGLTAHCATTKPVIGPRTFGTLPFPSLQEANDLLPAGHRLDLQQFEFQLASVDAPLWTESGAF